MDKEDQHIILRDGRRLGYAEYGTPGGIPLMLFHGTPGSRIFPGLDTAEWVQRLGFHVLTPERPGCGLSDPAPDRRIGDWAEDVAQLADHLGLDRFHVAGGSGGGPFALACALGLPDRVRSATLICTGCPPDTMDVTRAMSRKNRMGFFLARHAPVLLKALLGLMARQVKKPRKPPDEAVLRKKLAHLCAWDRRVILARKDDPRASEHVEEAFRQGAAGAYPDLMLVSHAWGLDMGALQIPVFLWHGTHDTLSPVAGVRAFAKTIPGCETHFIDGAGHMLLGDKALATRMMTRIAEAHT